MRLLALTMLALLPSLASAAKVTAFSPLGTVKDVRQATARFSDAMVTFGDPRLPDPFDVTCAAAGKGRWADAKNWVYDFTADLPAGETCTFKAKAGLRNLAGSPLTGTLEFTFATGGPGVRASLPYEGSTVDENQVFLLGLDAAATAASIAAHGYCAVKNLSERLPLQVLDGKEREDFLAQRRLLGYAYYNVLWKDGAQGDLQVTHDTLAKAEANIVVARCPRPLPADTDLDLVWGAGIATPRGAATTTDQVLKFKVRPAFTASFSCERTNASAPCVPVLPMQLNFTAPVARELARKIHLEGVRQHPARLDDDSDPFVQSLTFEPPFQEGEKFTVTLPAKLVDDAGRPLENAASFPLEVATDAAPPIAKFNGEFGILERSEGGVLPVTVRDLESNLGGTRIGGAQKHIEDEKQILQWMDRVREAMKGHWDDGGENYTQPGRTSVFGADDGAQAFELPPHEGGKAFEVVGIPLQAPGFHVVELASPRLGAALLGEKQVRYVATTALVTNLAVHFEWGRQGSLVFVTTLDTARGVTGAQLRIVDGCDGSPVWTGTTGADGTARIADALPKPNGWGSCSDQDAHPLMVSARKDGDFSFVLSSWDEGIQPSEFNIDTASWEAPTIAHTVLDRALFRAGETVSMKHFWREHTADGIAVPGDRPEKAVLQHEGSDQTIELPLSFDADGVAESQWAIPKEAKLGTYSISLVRGKDVTAHSGEFRVEQYRVPLMHAVVQAPDVPAVAARELPLDLFVGYFSGGGAAGLPVKLRTQVQPRTIAFPSYDTYAFGGAAVRVGIVEGGDGGYFPDDNAPEPMTGPARTEPLTLDANGAAHVVVPDLPASDEAQSVYAELEYPDANGELSSTRTMAALWPASLAVGVSTQGWAGSAGSLRFKTVVLDLKGRPVADQSVTVRLYERQTHSYRKRLVGGFYAYSHSEETKKLGVECSGRTNAQGLLPCDVAPGISGEAVLEAEAKDSDGRTARAVTSTYVAGKDDWWFAQGDSDRMDLIPGKKELEPGEKLRVQVRMPFRAATALVSVEREGVLDAFVTEISGKEPIIEVPITDRYAPNVVVSVLAVRPRVSDFRSKFYDFLRWLHLDRWFKLDGASPTAMVDLSKPAFRLGMTAVDVGWTAHRLVVAVKPDTDIYKTRGTAKVQVNVAADGHGTLPPSAEIAFTAVDEALLDLLPNPSVNLLDAMMQRRGVEVFTSTAQMQVVGKRHYGRKSLPPGGGGGRGAARELLDSLLLWKGRVPLDAQGHATIDVPLNDSLSSFRLTAIASAGADRFGTGSASIRTTQDVQLLSGLPPLVRENDRYDGVFTVRNTTGVAREIALAAEVLADGVAQPVLHATQSLTVPANGALPARFEVTAPFDATHLTWTVRAETSAGEPLDALKVAQDVAPAYPVRVYQATLLQLDGSVQVPVERPPDAIAGRGGIRVNLQSSLTASLDPVREWMGAYHYACFEQAASKAVVLGDQDAWNLQMSRLSSFQDGDGLVRYFNSEWLEGSDTLTAYLLAVADEAGWEIPDEEEGRMLDGLEGFVEGRVRRGSAMEQVTDQTDRRLAAIEALSRYDRAKPAWLSALHIDPNLWHTSALIDWIGILQRLEAVPDRDRRLGEARSILRSRLNFQGTTMGFSAEQDDALWWLMISADVNANRAILALLEDDTFREDLPRMMRGAVGRQLHGHWNLTTANAWGVLALTKFAAAFESTPVTGSTSASLGADSKSNAWKDGAAATLDLAWPAEGGSGVLKLAQAGTGKPWAIVQSRAALPLKEPLSSGYRITRTVTPVERKADGVWTRGDTARVHLDIDAQSDMTWVVIEDPVPGGATILGGGLGRDSQLLAQGGKQAGAAWPAYEERRFDFYRAYYQFVPKGKFSIEYTVRYNNVGRFEMPATHVEAMYAPEMLGEVPNAPLEVKGP